MCRHCPKIGKTPGAQRRSWQTPTHVHTCRNWNIFSWHHFTWSGTLLGATPWMIYYGLHLFTLKRNNMIFLHQTKGIFISGHCWKRMIFNGSRMHWIPDFFSKRIAQRWPTHILCGYQLKLTSKRCVIVCLSIWDWCNEKEFFEDVFVSFKPVLLGRPPG